MVACSSTDPGLFVSGLKLITALTFAAVGAGYYKRFLWSPLKSRKISFH